MATWIGKKIQNTFKGILKLSDNNTGVTSTPKSIESGDGAVSALELSTTRIKTKSGAIFEGDGSLITDIPTSNITDFDSSVAGTPSVTANTTHRGLTNNPHSTSDANIVVTDVTTNDVSSTKHGFAPKGDGDVTKFLNADGSYSIPSGTGGATDLSEGTSTTTTVDVNSSTGTNATLQQASGTRAGLLSSAKFDEIEDNNNKPHIFDDYIFDNETYSSLKITSLLDYRSKLDVTANYTLEVAHPHDLLVCDGTFTITLRNTDYSVGDKVTIFNKGTGVITLDIQSYYQDVISKDGNLDINNYCELAYLGVVGGHPTWFARKSTEPYVAPDISLVAEIEDKINENFVKEVFTYDVDDNVEKKEYKTDADVVVYTKDYVWDTDGIESWTITRASDDKLLKCTFIYSSGELVRKEYTDTVIPPKPTTWIEVAGRPNSDIHIYSITKFNGDIYGTGWNSGKLYKWNGVDAWVEALPKYSTVDRINSLLVHDGKIWGVSDPGTHLLSWDGINATWTLEVNPYHTSYEIKSIVLFNGKIYGGMSPFYALGGKLLEANLSTNTWVTKASRFNSQLSIMSLLIHNNELYASTGTGGRLFKWNGVDAWVQMAGQIGSNDYVYTLVEFEGSIYGAGDSGQLLKWSTGDTAWTVAATQFESDEVLRLIVHRGELYAGSKTSGKLLKWNGVDAWVEILAQLGTQKIECIYEDGVNIYAGTSALGKLYKW